MLQRNNSDRFQRRSPVAVRGASCQKPPMVNMSAFSRRHGTILLLAALAVLALAIRLLPGMPNVSAVTAFAMFAGFLLGRSVWGAIAAIGILAISDLVLGAYDWRIQASVYAALSFPALIGPFLRRLPRQWILPGALGGALGASFVFFGVTNFAVWLFGSSYPATSDGLIACYVAAIPFYRLTMVGDVLWTGIFFGGWLLATRNAASLSVLKGRPS